MKQPMSAEQRPLARRPFNMIEVVLGIGLLAFGLVAVLGVIPATLRTDRAAMQETHAAFNAEQFLSFLRTELRDPGNSYENWDRYVSDLPTSKPGTSEPSSWTEWVADDTVTYWSGGSDRQFFKALQPGPTDADPEFTAVCRVWRDQVTVRRLDGSTWVTDTVPVSEAVAINAEISWPERLPYAQRRKALFQVEVYRQ